MRDRHTLWRRILLAGLLLCLILTGFFVYLRATRNTTVERNANYVADAATQTAKRIDDLLVGAESSICAIAHMYEESLDPAQADAETLGELTDSTVFDYIGYVNADGILTENRGLQADVSDRAYVQDGLRGNSGIDVVFNGRVSGEDLVIFYAPLRLDGEVVGILTGRYRQQQMRDILTFSYFGEPANTYLCLPDGTVIASSKEEKPKNILDTLNRNDGADKEAVNILTDALSTGSSVSFTYTNSYGSSAAYVTKLPHSDWMLLQIFPIQVTSEMLNESGTAAAFLLLWLVILFALYILLLLLENHREKMKLTSEKQQMRAIVDSTSRLFSRFILADLEHDTYVILRNDDLTSGEHLPDRGAYSDLCDFWNSRFLDEEAAKCAKEQFSVRYIQEHLTEATPYLQYENRIQEDGIHWNQVSILCLKREGGVPTSVLLAIQDVTELKEIEQRSRAALEDAFQSAQAANDAKRTFLFDMSHDMRTPMNAIIGLSGLLDRDAGDPEKVRSYSRKINASGQHLLALINEVLDMSKIESGKAALSLLPFSLSELLEELTSVFQPQAQEKAQTLIIRAFGVPQERLIGDKLRLSELLGNLLSNAIKYTSRGGQVALTIRGLDQTTEGYVHLLFEVTDNGIGMSPEFVQHIFDPFARENNSTISGIQGAGLGMTITKSIVDLMGGTICVESTQGQGSVFKVELELRPAEDDDPEFWKKHSISKALILGTDKDICKSIQSLMAGTGVELQYSTDASITSSLAAGAGYDLILLDYTLSGMDTLEAIRFIRAQYGNTPTLILINNDWIEVEEDARSAGANGFLPAPFSMSTLRKVVAECRCQPQPDGKGVSLEGLRLLVAEDNDINAEILMELLDMEGVICERAINGREAVTLFQGKPETYYDGVLMDIQMPEVDGYETARAIRALDRSDAADIPIVAMTANAFAEDVKKSLEAGMNAHVAKPVDPKILTAVLSKLVEQRSSS
ncbi:MAG: response regulator [Bacillota bacterium]|nr:response regulator [Bacillota bacterium]